MKFREELKKIRAEHPDLDKALGRKKTLKEDAAEAVEWYKKESEERWWER